MISSTMTCSRRSLVRSHLVTRLPRHGHDLHLHLSIAEPPTYCWSKRDIAKKRNSWLSVIIFALSVYSTVMSAIWMVVSFVQPRWGHKISSRGGLLPSTATLVTALVAKTIELSFVTVFIACVGQVLTRRAIARRSRGMTLAEMTMRNWVIQPGSLITHCESVPYAAVTVLGALSLTASVVAMFYTTASDAMVAPKLKFGAWETVALQGHVRASYANAGYVKRVCPSLLEVQDPVFAGESCMNVQFSSQSYRNLMAFMEDWTNIYHNGSSNGDGLGGRPNGTTLLYDNTTMTSSWIEMQYSNVTAHHETYGRIINNVTLAMPHPGVYAAAKNSINGILQPDDLSGVGEYAIKAGVVSPSLNVMCVNMSPKELAPLIYTEWPGRNKKNATTWKGDIPGWADKSGKENYLNRTVVDHIFRWGPQYAPNKYVRRPPIFYRVSDRLPLAVRCWLTAPLPVPIRLQHRHQLNRRRTSRRLLHPGQGPRPRQLHAVRDAFVGVARVLDALQHLRNRRCQHAGTLRGRQRPGRVSSLGGARAQLRQRLAASVVGLEGMSTLGVRCPPPLALLTPW